MAGVCPFSAVAGECVCLGGEMPCSRVSGFAHDIVGTRVEVVRSIDLFSFLSDNAEWKEGKNTRDRKRPQGLLSSPPLPLSSLSTPFPQRKVWPQP